MPLLWYQMVHSLVAFFSHASLWNQLGFILFPHIFHRELIFNYLSLVAVPDFVFLCYYYLGVCGEGEASRWQNAYLMG